MNTIITISREFGSGGHLIGKKVAERLGYKYYDKEIIERCADETGLAQDYIRRFGEHAGSQNVFAYSFVGRTSNGLCVEDYIFQMQHKIICDIADKENAVIIGRCADAILADRPNVLNIFIEANEKAKVKRIMEADGKTEKEAVKLMHEMDKKRAINYAYCTDGKWGQREHYDAILSSSTFGYDKCVDIIVDLAKSFSK